MERLEIKNYLKRYIEEETLMGRPTARDKFLVFNI